MSRGAIADISGTCRKPAGSRATDRDALRPVAARSGRPFPLLPFAGAECPFPGECVWPLAWPFACPLPGLEVVRSCHRTWPLHLPDAFRSLSSIVHPGRAQIFFGVADSVFSMVFPSSSGSFAVFSELSSFAGGVSSGGVFFLAARIRFAWMGQTRRPHSDSRRACPRRFRSLRSIPPREARSKLRSPALREL